MEDRLIDDVVDDPVGVKSVDDAIGPHGVIGVNNFIPRSQISIPKKPKDFAKKITKLLDEGKQHFAANQVPSEFRILSII